MHVPERTYVQAVARHHRVVVFVDSTIPEDILRQVMQANLHIWGGRYNPIVPVHQGAVSPDWQELVKPFDPDFVYYSDSIDLSVLQGLGFLHPKEYIPLRHDGHLHIPGVNIHQLLHANVYDRFTTQGLRLLEYQGRWDMPLPAKSFYQLNFGFMPPYFGEDRLIRKYERVEITEKNAHKINELIARWQPYFKSNLSALHPNTVYLRPSQYQADSFEWIVYDSANYLENLLYFWNRQLYFQPANRLMQVVTSLNELEELLAAPHPELLVHYLAFHDPTYLVSIGMPTPEKEQVRNRLQAQCPRQRITLRDPFSFPFTVERYDLLLSSLLQPVKTSIIGTDDFIRLPVLAFENAEPVDDGPYAIDIHVEKRKVEEKREVQFPVGTSLHHLVLTGKTRVTRSRRITLLDSGRAQTVDFRVPDDLAIIRSVLHYREKQTELIHLPIEDTQLSPAGQKLMAFYQLFESDAERVRLFLEEKFWLQLFRYDSSLKESAIKSGRGIFSHQDLEKELAGLVQLHRPAIVASLKERDGQEIKDELIDSVIKNRIKEAFDLYIDPGIEYLVKRGGLLMGMKVKCEVCGSNRWYSLAELSDKVVCKGCNNIATPNLTSKVYFKVSDILINNLLSDPTKNGKEFEGNYVVIKTLLHLKRLAEQTGNSFGWCGPLAYRTQGMRMNWDSDFDITALVNGRLALGECKSKLKDFSTEEIDRLVWAGNSLSPDIIIVSCLSGSLDNVAQKLRDRITNPACEILSYIPSGPMYFLPPLFGIR